MIRVTLVIRADGGGALGKTQSAAVPRRRARRHGGWRGRSAAHHRRGRLGQDLDARASRRVPDRERRRPAPHHALDLLAPRRHRDDAAGRPHPERSRAGRHRRNDRGDMGGNVPFRRRAAAARACRGHRARARLHHSRPRGFRRPDEPGPPRPRIFQDRKALPDQGHMPRDLFARGEQRSRARGGTWCVFSVVRHVARRAGKAVRPVCGGQAAPAGARLRRSPALLGAHDAGGGDRAADRGALRPRAGRRISGHQPAPGFGAAGAAAERQRA